MPRFMVFIPQFFLTYIPSYPSLFDSCVLLSTPVQLPSKIRVHQKRSFHYLDLHYGNS
jgi:hypothetical protein